MNNKPNLLERGFRKFSHTPGFQLRHTHVFLILLKNSSVSEKSEVVWKWDVQSVPSVRERDEVRRTSSYTYYLPIMRITLYTLRKLSCGGI